MSDMNEPHRFRMFYSHCGTEWEDTWSCACNDRCPVCNREIEPYDFGEMESEESED